MKNIFKRFFAVLVSVALCITLVIGSVCVSADTYTKSDSYDEYLNKTNGDFSEETVTLTADNLSTDSKNATVGEYEGKTAVLTTDDSTAKFNFTVLESGYFSIKVKYCGIKGKKADILRSVTVNGTLPFKEAENIAFRRQYKNESEKFEKDSLGNQIRPIQTEVFVWQETYLSDRSGFYNEPLKFYFEAGENAIEFTALAEPMAISEIVLCKPQKSVSYKEYRSSVTNTKAGAKVIRLQGENAYLKSDYAMAPISVSSSAELDPVSLTSTVYNAIGGNNWQTVGDAITWKFNVEEAGNYKISLHLLQSTNTGALSYRKLLIDGVCPFREVEHYAFDFEYDWYNETLHNADGDFEFFFTEGEHTLTLTVTLGDLAEILHSLQTDVEELNKIYREFLVIMGSEPDTYRDYQFDLYIPETIKKLKVYAEKLKTAGKAITELYGTKTGDTQFLERFSEQLSKMYKEESEIAKSYSSFQNNISTLADFVANAKNQAMSVDYIDLTPVNKQISKSNVGFFDKVLFGVKRFLLSFTSEYSTDAENNKESVSVWVGSGRDQAQIIRSLATNDFTAKYDINVNLDLVPTSALLPAMLADQCPDVVLSLPSTDIANYAYRGALLSLEDFEGVDKEKERFSSSALEPLTYNGKLYSLPETQTFYVMFYRKDILEELGVEIPKTWTEVFEVLPVLQKNNMTIGMPMNRLAHFAMVLNQYDSQLYNKELTKTLINNDTAIEAFSMITSLFADYEVLQSISFVNRFRTGSIPIGIEDYTMYNTLEISAPEISGTWGFAAVPGIEKEDGTISNVSIGTTTGSVLTAKGKNQENGYKFLSWWTSADIQSEYGRQIENELGSSARYASANLETMQDLPWVKSDYEMLTKLWKNVKGIPEVPGGYYLGREINFAFSAVVNNDKDVAEELNDAAKEINKEIAAKRKEFGLTKGEKS